MDGDDFFEVNNEIPFKKIQEIKISDVTVTEHNVEIKAFMKLDLGPQGQYKTLSRSDADIGWLLENLSGTEQCPLLPKTDCSDMFSQVYQYIGGTQPLRNSKLKMLKQRVLLRCLTLISTLLLKHLKQINEELTIPIFIFFHDNFALYHNPIYYKHEKVSIQKKVGNYFWEKYTMLIGKGNSWEQLENAKKRLTEERQRLFEVTNKLQEYVGQLNKLQDQFISEKEKIKKRTGKAQQLCISYQMQLKYLDLVIEQAKQTAVRAEQQRSQCQKLIIAYGEVLRNECEQALKTNQKLLTEYVRVICDGQQKLRIAPH